MKKLTNWSVIGLAVLVIVAIIFSYGLVKLYNGVLQSTSVPPYNETGGGSSAGAPDSPTPGESEDDDSSTDPMDPALYQVQIAALQERIAKTDENLHNVIAQLGLTVEDLVLEDQEMPVNAGLFLNWQKKSGVITGYTGKWTPAEIEEALVTAAEAADSFLLLVEEETTTAQVKKSFTFGFEYEGTEVITHQYSLVRQVATNVPTKARLAFIIDDLGYEWKEFDRMMTIPRPMTFAVIPHLPRSTRQAQQALENGYDLILHQPMEPSTPNNPGEGAIYTTMSEDEIIETLSRNLANVPQGLIGVNNHMGSKATADPRVMEVVLKFFRERGLFFVDSSTAPDSVVATVARQVGEDFAENRIFLDNVDELEAIKTQIRKAAAMALRDKQVIAIGHVRNYTAKAILEMIPEIEAMGIEIVYAKELLERQ